MLTFGSSTVPNGDGLVVLLVCHPLCLVLALVKSAQTSPIQPILDGQGIAAVCFLRDLFLEDMCRLVLASG